MSWEIIQKETYAETWRNVEEGVEATIKFDGCVHYYRLYNGSTQIEEDSDYIHICDIDSQIEILQWLKQRQKEAFGL